MPDIFYTASNYNNNFSHLNTNNIESISCRKLDLYRSIVTVGSPSFVSWREIKQNGLFRTISNSIIQKALLVQNYIESDRNGMRLHPIYDSQVSDQKRIVSYNLGMAFAKFYAEKLLNIPNLTHLETLKKINAVSFVNPKKTAKEPDLVGMTSNGNWHVFEAKGMSASRLNGEIIKAKNQAKQVAMIHGQVPETLSACATYFNKNRILSHIEDPISENNKEIIIEKDKFYDGYYNSFFAFREYLDTDTKRARIDNIDFHSFNIRTNKLNLSIGLETEIYELIQQRDYKYIDEYYKKKRDYQDQVNSTISIGQDGFIVKYLNY